MMTDLLHLGVDQVEVPHFVLVQLHGALPRLSLAGVHAVQHLLMWRCMYESGHVCRCVCC